MPRIKEMKKEYLARDFSLWLIGQIKENGLTQGEVAHRMGTSQQNFSYKLNNQAFSFRDFLKLMEIFKPDADELMKLVRSW